MKTLVLGASPNPSRYSYRAIQTLVAKGHEVVAIGKRPATVGAVSIETETIPFDNIHTVTLYLNEQHQAQYEAYILSLHPKRIIFNPGAENERLYALAAKENIEVLEACTLVMLQTRQY